MTPDEVNYWMMTWTEVGAIATGCATIAAVVYMHLQTKILKRQTEIQLEQNKLIQEQNKIVAWQSEIFAHQAKIDMYDRIWVLFGHTMELFNIVVRNATLKREDIFTYRINVNAGEFLLDAETWNYLSDTVTIKAIRLMTTGNQMAEDRHNPDYHQWSEENHELVTWFIDQPNIAKEKFRPYLKLSQSNFLAKTGE